MYRYVLGAALLAALPVQAQADEAIGAWNFTVVTDPMSDAVRGIAHTSFNNELTLVVKCDKNGPGSIYLSIISKKYLGRGRYAGREMKYRFDGGTPISIVANHDGSSASIFDLSPNTKGGSFLAGLLQSKETVLQVSSFDYASFTSVIDTTGAEDAIKKVAATCRDAEWGG